MDDHTAQAATTPDRTDAPRTRPEPQGVPSGPVIAALASLLIPGLGQVLNGDAAKGALIFVALGVGWSITYLAMAIIIGFLFWPVVVCLHLWNVHDAWTGARAAELARGTLG